MDGNGEIFDPMGIPMAQSGPSYPICVRGSYKFLFNQTSLPCKSGLTGPLQIWWYRPCMGIPVGFPMENPVGIPVGFPFYSDLLE